MACTRRDRDPLFPRRCPSRREFLGDSAGWLLGPVLLGGCAALPGERPAVLAPLRPCGPGSRCTPRIHAAFVRRKGPYGMRWPGAIYDGEAARRRYAKELGEAADSQGVQLELRAEPLYSLAAGEAWLASCAGDASDGLVLILLDRQEHAWPTAYKAAASDLPAVIYSPLGTSFTTNTARLASQPGCVVYSSDDFSQAIFGLKMLAARARIRRSRCIVLRGDQRAERELADVGTALSYVPARDFLEEYQRQGESEEVRALAEQYLRAARGIRGASRQDVLNAARGYFSAAAILRREEGDAITMDCLGALGRSKVSLPCLAWSRMNDEGIPAACEADLGAVAAHMIVQQLFDRPGFQQDPVADTAAGAITGSHCTCATRLEGFDRPGVPFDLVHHHGNRDAVPRPLWRAGQRVTSLDVLPGGGARRSKLLVAAGTVLENVAVPPSGGCVVAVKVKFDGEGDVLSFPGFHQVFFYGEYQRHLRAYAQLHGFDVQVA